MSVGVYAFRPEHLPTVRRLVESAYERPRSAAFYRWAYLDPPAHRAWVAMDDGECVGLLRGFVRRYRLGERVADVLETFDWYTAPAHRSRAVGLRLLRAAMAGPEPLINVGGTEETLALLPRLGWRAIAQARSYVLPLADPTLPPEPARRLGRLAPAARIVLRAGTGTWFRPVRRGPPAGGEAIPVTVPGDEIARLYEGDIDYAVVPLPDPAHLRWLASGYPGAGQFLSLEFATDDGLRGWGMARVYAVPGGVEAALIEVYAPRPTPTLYAWMASELVRRVAGYRPTRVRALASCPVLGQALHGLHFLGARSVPVHTWGVDEGLTAGPSHFTLNTQDQPLLPYSTRLPFEPSMPRAE